MRMTNILLTAASVFVAACASDSTTGPDVRIPSTQLVAIAGSPIALVGAATVTFDVVVTNNLQETVTGGVCAETVEAKPLSGGSWTTVTSSTQACSMIAAILAPRASLSLSAAADRAKLNALANGSANSVLMRVRHSLTGQLTGQNYLVQSNEITVSLN